MILYILYVYYIANDLWLSASFLPQPFNKFQHPAASSTRSRLVSRSDAACVAKDEFAPLSLQHFLPTRCAWCEERIQRLLSNPIYLGVFLLFLWAFAKLFHLSHPELLHPKAEGWLSQCAASLKSQPLAPSCSGASILFLHSLSNPVNP